MKKALFVLFLLVFSVSPVWANDQAVEKSEVSVPADKVWKVRDVVDGDSFFLTNDTRVNLIGVDAPELINSPKLLKDARHMHQSPYAIKTMGRRSRNFLEQLIGEKKVLLDADTLYKDEKGNWWAHVSLEDGTSVNAEMIREGFAVSIEDPGNLKFADQYLALEEEARESYRGLWKNLQLYETETQS